MNKSMIRKCIKDIDETRLYLEYSLNGDIHKDHITIHLLELQKILINAKNKSERIYRNSHNL